MKLWTSAHADLLESLQAQQIIPPLFSRLSLERYVAREDDLRRLVAWPRVLRQQPGWPLIEPALHEADAWPETWHMAREMGFEPLAHHHHALLFSHLTHRLLTDRAFEQALWTWEQTIWSWRMICETPYLIELIADVASPPEVPEDDEQDVAEKNLDGEALSPAHAEILATLLHPMIDAHTQSLHDALGMEIETLSFSNARFDRRRARFHQRAFNLLLHMGSTEARPEEESHSPVLDLLWGGLVAKTRLILDTLHRTILESFQKQAEQLNVNEDDSQALLAPFEWIDACAEVFGLDDEVATAVITQGVELGWKLRRTGREEEGDDFERLIQLTRPFQDHLSGALERGSLVGPNSKCSDMLVFYGEHSEHHPERKQLFERALAICPGHRNASLMLSYEHLYLASQAFNALSLIPAPLRHLPGGERPTMLWRKAKEHIDDARQIYPFNSKLDEYDERLEKEATRLRITPASDS